MKTIFKYILKLQDEQKVLMPSGSRMLTVQEQYFQIMLWAEIETSNPQTSETFFIVGTGREIPCEGLIYIGTVQQGPFVWHVYHKP